MRRRCTLLVNLLVVLGLVLSGHVAIAPLPIETSEARVIAPAGAAKTDDAPALANRRANRQQDRRQDLRQDRKQDRTQADRQQDRKQKDRKHDRKRADNAQEQGREGDWREFCTGPDSTRLPKVDLCIHGADPAPAGLDVEQPVELSSTDTETAESAPPAPICEGDGQSGYRVQVLYVYPDNQTSQFDESLVADLSDLAAQADQIFHASAVETGAARHLRFVHDAGEPCQLSVAEVKIPAGSIGRFDAMITQLRAQGYNRTNRIYLAFTDATNYCGVGTLWNDDRANSANWNSFGPSYSRVDAGCWTGMVAAHEVMHNLGGVQNSAPNASGGFHCIDEYDVMCYPDAGSGLPRMRFDCNDSARNTTFFDCGHNDYYHTNPAPGSYLSRCWNPGNNRFLIGAVSQSSSTPCTPPPPPPPPDITKKKDDKKDKKDKKGKSKHGNGKKHKKKR